MSDMIITTDEKFKGHDMLKFYANDADKAAGRPVFSLGKKKAQFVVDNIEAFRAFVA